MNREELKERFKYINGDLIYRHGVGPRSRGDIAGSRSNSDRYLSVFIKGKKYYIHRLVWVYFNGENKTHHIDHINKNKLDNRIENLRLSNNKENHLNISAMRNSSTGILGVSLYNRKGNIKRYVAEIGIDGKTIKLKLTDDIVEAAATRLAVEQCLGIDKLNKNSDASKFIKNYVTRNV